MLDVRRREFITLLGGAAGWPFVARAQQPALPVVGFLNSGSSDTSGHYVAAFERGLNETGYVNGRNFTIDFRWADGRNDRLPALAAELVRRHVAVLVAVGGSVSSQAAKMATSTIPIVFAGSGDPVAQGLATSLNHPGGNATGAVGMGTELGAKRLEFLRELVPGAAVIALLVNPSSPNAEFGIRALQTAAGSMRQEIKVVNARSNQDLDAVFASLEQQVGGLLVASDAFFNSRRNQLVGLAARHAVPSIYDRREFVEAGGLISYGSRFTETYRQVGIYTGRILKGESPGDLAIMQPTRFELMINLKTAKALGLTVPHTLLVRSNEVIE
jgi:putative tryptophan/tyrosine transport system substrate-binding protein